MMVDSVTPPEDEELRIISNVHQEAETTWNDPKKRQAMYDVLAKDRMWNTFASGIAGCASELFGVDLTDLLDQTTAEYERNMHLKIVIATFMAHYARLFREREK
jgi:hypothetical protein